MALVRMLVQITGLRNGESWPVIGEVLDLPDDEAAVHIGMNNAEPVPDGAPVARDWRNWQPPPPEETYGW
jgi:hypothetical protein